MKVGIDLDGVVCDYEPLLVKEFNKRFNTNYDPNNISPECVYHIREHSITKGKKDISDIVDYHVENKAFKRLEPIAGAIKGIQDLKKYGHSVHILTWRRDRAQQDTIYWLNKHQVPYDSISFGHNKGEMSKLIGVRAVIDDNVKCIEDILDNGLIAIIFNSPYNLNWEGKIYTPKKGAWVRVKDWEEITKFFEKNSG